MSRSSVVWTGLFGLIGAIILTALCVVVMLSGRIPALFSQSLFVWGLFLFLLFFTVVEIPVMVFSMKRIAVSPNPRAKYVVLITNTGFVFFAAVYAVPFILLAGHSTINLLVGVLLAGLAFVRFFSSLIFLPEQQHAQFR